MRSPLPWIGLAALVAGAATPAAGQELGEPEVAQRRLLQVISARGRLADEAVRPLRVRLRRGDRTALDTPVESEPDGGFAVRLVTARLLLPGRYTLEVLSAEGEEPLASRGLVVGAADEVEPARARQLRWLEGAARAVRDLTATLERRGRYHAALAWDDPEAAAAHQTRLRRFAEGWNVALRTAHMDLATFGRRVLLPDRPEVVDALEALLPLLAARRDEWLDVLEAATLGGLEQEPVAPDAIRRRAGEVVAGLGWEAERLADWEAGPLGEPWRAYLDAVAAGGPAAAGPWESPLGFRVALPEGLEALPADKGPSERLVAAGPGVRAVVVVRDLPDAADPGELVRALDVLNWEEYRSYKLIEREDRLEEGWLRRVFEANTAELDQPRQTARVLQRTLLFPAARRAVSLVVAYAPGDEDAGELVAALEAGFEAVE